MDLGAVTTDPWLELKQVEEAAAAGSSSTGAAPTTGPGGEPALDAVNDGPMTEEEHENALDWIEGISYGIPEETLFYMGYNKPRGKGGAKGQRSTIGRKQCFICRKTGHFAR